MERDNNPRQYGVQPSNNGRIETFTENGVFIVPQGVEEVYVSGCGGGGGGGGVYKAISGIATASAGASGANCQRLKISVAPGMAINIVVGKKGIGGASGANNGTAGGDSMFGDFLTLPGGLGGLGQSGNGSQIGNRSSLSGVVNGVIAPMWDRADPYSGCTPFGEGNSLRVCSSNGEVFNGLNAIGYGGAGSNGCANTNLTTPVSAAGGDGHDGILIVEW